MAQTRSRILEAAESRARRAGYNGFSFRDLADDVGVKSSSVHYHFRTKEDLAAALVGRYRAAALEALGPTEGHDPVSALRRLAGLFVHANETDDQMCLCGVLGAEAALLPEPVRREVMRYFEALTGWLDAAGRGPLSAQLVVAALEGALLSARVRGEPGLLRRCVEELAGLQGGGAAAG